MIGQKGIPTLFGGIERHVEEVSLRLAQKKNYQVFVYTRKYYTSKKLDRYRQVNLISLPSLKTKHLDAISHTFLATLHALFKLRAEVIHYHGIGPAFNIWIPKIFRPRTKIVFTFHCRDYFHEKWGAFAQFALSIGEMMGCYLADEIIPVSLEIQKYTESQYNRKTDFIPHGVNPVNHVPAQLIKQWGLKENNYILAVSRLIAHKGIHYLIKAFQQVKTDKKLVIIGPGFYTQDYKAKLEKMAGGDNQIMFLGAQQGKILKELYSNACLFVNPSEQEGLPLAVLEAGSFGRPLLLSNIGIHKQMFKSSPFLFKNKSIKDLKQKLEFILKNPKIAKERAKEIKDYSRKTYNWDKVVEKIALRYI